MAESPLVKKLRIQAGQRILIVNPPAGYLDQLQPLPEGVETWHEPVGSFDFVQVFAKDIAELEKLGPPAVAAGKHDCLLWVSYPKQTAKVPTDLNRDVCWQVVGKWGVRPVSQVAVDAVWSALRFRPAELYKE